MFSFNLIIYFLSSIFGFLADFTFTYIIIIFVQDLTHSSTMVGFNFFLIFLPFALLSSYAGVLADKFSRKWLLFTSQLIIIGVIFSIVLFVKEGVINSTSIYSLSILLVLYGLCFAFIPSSSSSLLGNIVKKNSLEKNAIVVSLIGMLMFSISPLVSGYIKEKVDWATLFLLPLILFGLSNICLLGMKINVKKINNNKSSFSLFKIGLNEILNSTKIKFLFLQSLILSFFIVGPYQVIIPQYCLEVLEVTEFQRGLLMSFVGVGLLVGCMSTFFFQKMKNKLYWVSKFLFIVSILTLLLSGVNSFKLAVVIFIFAGLLIGFSNTLIFTSLQVATNENSRGRVLSLFYIITIALPALSGFFAGVLSDFTSLTNSLFVFSLISLICFFLLSKNLSKV
jgi:MFS family permease